MWQLTNDRPIFLQIAEKLEADIACRKYEPGQRLESVRELAQQAGVNPNTMQRALAELERSGIVHSRRGEGRYVTEELARIEQLARTIIDRRTEAYILSLRALGFQRDEILECLKTKLEENAHGCHS